jgi:hypothetical protein
LFVSTLISSKLLIDRPQKSSRRFRCLCNRSP